MRKGKPNELSIEKLLKIIHFLTRDNLAVKELHPDITSFLGNEVHESIIKQYLEMQHKIPQTHKMYY